MRKFIPPSSRWPLFSATDNVGAAGAAAMMRLVLVRPCSQAARAILLEILAEMPHNSRSRYTLGTLEQSDGNLEEALSHFRMGMKSDGERPPSPGPSIEVPPPFVASHHAALIKHRVLSTAVSFVPRSRLDALLRGLLGSGRV